MAYFKPKIIIILVILTIASVILIDHAKHKFTIIDEYLIKGFNSGSIYRAYKLVEPNVSGLSVCDQRYIYGWSAEASNLTFVIDTKNHTTDYFGYDYSGYRLDFGCDYPSMDSEVNLISLTEGEEIFFIDLK